MKSFYFLPKVCIGSLFVCHKNERISKEYIFILKLTIKIIMNEVLRVTFVVQRLDLFFIRLVIKIEINE